MPAFTSLRQYPERWLFTLAVVLQLAPVVMQGLDRPLASFFHREPSGVVATAMALAVALAGWLACVAGERLRTRRLVVSAVLAVGAVGCLARLSPTGCVAIAAVAACIIALPRWLFARLPEAMDGLSRRHRALTVCYGLGALLSIVQVSRVSVFVADPTVIRAQVVPGVKFLQTHSCLTAYVRASELACDGAENLYLAERWPQTIDAEVRPRTPFSPFDVDAYFYPPTFLLVSSILSPLRGDFLAQRAAWFGLNGVLLAFGFWVVARELGGARWHRPLLVAPLFFGSLPVLSLLQIGNAQGAVCVVAVLAMLAFERERPVLGGFALALATAAKISPGILVVVLVAQRRWRAVAWTAVFGVALSIATLAAFGTDPVASFLGYMLPRLSSGVAFSEMLHHPESVAMNTAPFGAPFKLALLGVDVGDPFRVGRIINRVVTLCVVALAITTGRRHLAASARSAHVTLTAPALAWMALLFLVALRSPFAPAYVGFSFVWGITLLTSEVETRRGGVLLLVLFALTTLLPPLPAAPLAVFLTIPQLTTIAVSAWLILRRPKQALPAGAHAGS